MSPATAPAPAPQEILEAAYRQAEACGVSRAQFDLWLQARLCTPEQKAAAMRRMFAVVACAESQVQQLEHLRELAGHLLVPVSAVVADYHRWLAQGGRPAA